LKYLQQRMRSLDKLRREVDDQCRKAEMMFGMQQTAFASINQYRSVRALVSSGSI
jgi:hypothetical protein